MKYTASLKWEKDFDCDGLLYFIQRVEEMLFHYSTSLYRVPLLNTNGLIKEYCELARQVEQGIQKEYQLAKLFDEFLYSFNNDIVLKECWGEVNVARITKTFGSLSKKDKLETIQYLQAVFGNRIYYNWCVKTLRKYIQLPREKKKLEKVIRCWLPELMSFGYDSNYIYCEIKKYLSQKTILNEEALDRILEIFDFKFNNYNVYFAVPKTMIVCSKLLNQRLRLNFEDDGNFKKFKINKKRIIVYFSKVRSRCPNLAAAEAYQRFNIFLKFYKLVGNKQFVRVDRKAMVVREDTNAIDYVPFTLNMYHIAAEINYDKIATTSDQLITGILSNLHGEEIDLLSRAIDLHNTALESTDLKSGYLNLWSSIEVLCSNQYSESKLKAVLNVLMPILKKDYLSEIIADVIKSFEENLCVEDIENILSKVQTAGCTNKKFFYLCLSPEYDELRNTTYSLLANYPVLRSRISQLASLKTTQELSDFIELYGQRIEWHIYRMYRVRNSIVHSGIYPVYLKDLGQHLHSYSDALLNEFLSKFDGDISFDSVNNVLTDIKFTQSNFSEMLLTKQPISEQIINRIIHPEINNIMECEKHLQE